MEKIKLIPGVPMPVLYEGKTLRDAVKQYYDGIIGLMEDARDVDLKLEVSQVNLYQDAGKWYLVAMVEEDRTAELISMGGTIGKDMAVGAYDELKRKAMQRDNCTHDWETRGGALYCPKCDSYMDNL